MDAAIQALKKQLLQLKDQYAGGGLTEAQFNEKTATLERRLLDAVLNSSNETNHGSRQMTGAAGASRQSIALYSLMAVGVIVIAGAGYWWTGSPSQTALTVPNPAAASLEAPVDAAQANGVDQISMMTDRLAARLQEQPNDAEGWAMLARSYSFLGRHPEALAAYEKAVNMLKDDPTLLADYADSLAVKNNRSLQGEPMKQVAAALKLDPRNLKALSLAGTDAYERKDYALAAKYWGDVVQYGPADSPMVQQIAPSLAEARQLAGLPAISSPVAVAAADASAEKSVGTTLTGIVSLSAAFQKNANPDDTVFVFARAAEGSRMPLAIIKKQVRDLPLSFRLDDSSSMSPASRLSMATQVIVGARVSRSGNAMPQPGDLMGQSDVVSVGASNLRIEISDTVKP